MKEADQEGKKKNIAPNYSISTSLGVAAAALALYSIHGGCWPKCVASVCAYEYQVTIAMVVVSVYTDVPYHMWHDH